MDPCCKRDSSLEDVGTASHKGGCDLAASNYVRVSRENNEIRGQYLLDLALVRPPLAENEYTENLALHTKSGAVTADIWITHDGSDRSRRASLVLRSDNGSVFAKVHDPYSNGEKRPRPSLTIALRASHGSISFSIPRCFRGPITIWSTHGRIAFSPDLERSTALLLDVNGGRVYFVGKRPLTGKWRSGEENDAKGREEDPLDELSVGGIHTSVRFNWVDEPEVVPETKPNRWEDVRFGAKRFLTTGRL